MYIGYTPELEALRDELREYYAQLLTPAVIEDVSHSEGIGPVSRRVWKRMAADGWAGIGWPKEYGGQGRTPIEQFVFFDEAMRAGAPVPMLTINSVAPTIMRFGTQEQKDFYLPKILAGDIHFCIGYTESDAGTDLASLKTSAVRDGDEYVINGQKVFTSLASDADYVWLAVRTNPEVKKHKGISIIIVPTDTPGFKCEPIRNFGNVNTNITFYEDVRVHARLEFLKVANWQVAWNATLGAPLNPADASTIKVFGTEFYMEAFRLLMEVLGAHATVQEGSPGAVLSGRIESRLRSMHILTFGGGTNEMQRDLIAIFGLNMPGSPR